MVPHIAELEYLNKGVSFSRMNKIPDENFEPNERALVVATQGYPAVAERDRKQNYIITPLMADTVPTYLERGVDFGVVPKTHKPSLYKSGAEKIISAYRFMPRYTVESKIEQFDAKGNAFFYYLVKCSLFKGVCNPETHEFIMIEYANGFGSANTGESRNGFNSGVNAANNCIKMAQKRAMVQAVLAISGLSSMFTQDIEDETSVQAKDVIEQKPTDVITTAQATRLFSFAGQKGMSKNQLQQWLAAKGITKSREMTLQQFEDCMKELEQMDKGEE